MTTKIGPSPGVKDIKVGPLESGEYVYRIGDRLSAETYHNAASAWHDARRPQEILEGRLVPEHRSDDVSRAARLARAINHHEGFRAFYSAVAACDRHLGNAA